MDGQTNAAGGLGGGLGSSLANQANSGGASGDLGGQAMAKAENPTDHNDIKVQDKSEAVQQDG